jgi:hypothetical protein
LRKKLRWYELQSKENKQKEVLPPMAKSQGLKDMREKGL